MLSAELRQELLLCSRFGDLEDITTYFSSLSQSDITEAINHTDERGNTMLHFCSANGHSEILALLLSHQAPASIDSANEGGNTALHWSALNGHLPIIKLLVEAGADVKVRNNRGRVPVDEAESQGHEQCVLWFLALDMKREQEAGGGAAAAADEAPDGLGDDDDDIEGDVQVSIRAGDTSVPKETSTTESLTQQVDEMDMLD